MRNVCTCCRKNLFLDYSGHGASKSHENDGGEKYLFGISGLGAVLVISCIVIACRICRHRVKPSIVEENQETRSEENNSLLEIYEIPFSRDERQTMIFRRIQTSDHLFQEKQVKIMFMLIEIKPLPSLDRNNLPETWL